LGEEDEEYIKKYIKESVVDKTISDIAKITGENEQILHELFRLLAGSNAQLFENTNLANTLKTNRNKITQYISLLEKAYLIKVAYNYTTSVTKQVRSSRKQYNAHSSITLATLDYPLQAVETKEVAGHLVEATIANHHSKISFWRTPHEEVDIIIETNGKPTPIEVKYQNTPTKDDQKGLLSFCKKHKTKRAILVTEDTLKEEETQGVKVTQTPAWLHLLTKTTQQ